MVEQRVGTPTQQAHGPWKRSIGEVDSVADSRIRPVGECDWLAYRRTVCRPQCQAPRCPQCRAVGAQILTETSIDALKKKTNKTKQKKIVLSAVE